MGGRPDGGGNGGNGVLAGPAVPLLPQSLAVVKKNKFRDSVSIPSDENVVQEFQSWKKKKKNAESTTGAGGTSQGHLMG